jgi:hypothetical protein
MVDIKINPKKFTVIDNIGHWFLVEAPCNGLLEGLCHGGCQGIVVHKNQPAPADTEQVRHDEISIEARCRRNALQLALGRKQGVEDAWCHGSQRGPTKTT